MPEDSGQIRRFGCIAYAKIPINERKFSERAIRAIMVGYSATGYVLWHPPTEKFLHSRHVRCNEKLVYKNTLHDKSEMCNKLVEVENSEETEKEEAYSNPEEKEYIEENNLTENSDETEKQKAYSNSEEKQVKTEVRPKKREAERKNPHNLEVKKRNLPGRNAKTLENREKYMATRRIQKLIEDTSLTSTSTDSDTRCNKNNLEDELGHVLLASINKDHTSYREAMESNDKIRWLESINEELNSMQENHVWKIVDRPTKNKDGNKIHTIDSKRVFKKKTGDHGEIVYEGRLVIRGFSDRNEYVLKETYAPVSRLAVIRAALAIINKYNLEAHQMDVKTAFLNGVLEEELYMEIPDGLECDPEVRKTKVCLLQKSLHGLRISPKRWNVRCYVSRKEVI